MKAQGQRDLANTQPPGSGARQPAASCLSVSFLHLFPAEPHSAPPRARGAGRAGGSRAPRQVTPAGSATLALRARAVAQAVSTGLAPLSLCCPGAPEEAEQDSADLGKVFFSCDWHRSACSGGPRQWLGAASLAAPLRLRDFLALHWERAWPCPQISRCSLESGRIRNQ